MNILIDLRPIQSGKISGVETFTINIVKEIIKQNPENNFYLWTNSINPLSDNFPKFKGKNVFHIHTKKSNKILNLLLSILRYPKIDKLIKKNIDVIFLPDLRPAPVSKNTKKYQFVHDLSFIHFPKNFSVKSRIWHKLLRVKKELKEAKKIFVPSEFTKNDLVKTLRIPKEKIIVTYEGVEEKFQTASKEEIKKMKEKYNLPKNFILSLCTLEPRKNLKTLIEAFNLFQKKHPKSDLKLVIAGKKDEKLFAKLKLPNIKNIIYTGFVDENDKIILYSAATMFAFPSLFEGFGLPVLEAMACGIPIIASNTSSIPELVEDATLLFNPLKTEEICESIEKIYFDKKLKKSLKNQGLKQAKKFNWRKTANLIIK